MGLLPLEPISSEVMTCDMKHMLDVWSFEVNKKWREIVPQEVLFNNKDIHAKLNDWKYVNSLMDYRDRANSSSLQDILCYPQLLGWTIGNRMHIHSQVAREIKVVELWAFNESTHKARHQTLRSTKYEQCKLEWQSSYTIGYVFQIQLEVCTNNIHMI